MKTIPEEFNNIAKKFAKKSALKFKYHGTYIKVSFATLQKRVETMTKGLAELGVKKGDRVAILSENRTEWVRTDLAILTLGAITVPVHTTLSPKIIKHVINDCGAKILLVSDQEQFNKIQLVIDELPELKTIIYISLDHPEHYEGKKALIKIDEVMRKGEESKKEVKIEAERDDIASIVYTSGTTAMPKGVMLTHRNFLFDAEAALTAVPITEKDTLLSFLPLSHVMERTGGYYAPLVLRGATIAYAESIKTLSENLQEIKPTILISVPRIFEKIHKSIWDKVKQGSPLKRKIFVWSLKQVPGTFGYTVADTLVFHKIKAKLGGRFRLTISGGASLNHKLARFFDRIGIKIVEGYGLTETAPVVAVNRPNQIEFGTVGKHLPGIELMLGKDKEILTRGPNLMKGYYNQPELTKEVIDENGWFHTGDLGFIDNTGFLTIIGRKKEMISLSNGKNVWPEQIELMLNDDKLIAQSMVYGNKRSYLTALLIPDWQEVNRRLDELGLNHQEPDELIANEKMVSIFRERIGKINDQFADWEKIKKFKIIPKEFSQEKNELTPTLKLRRQAIIDNNKQSLDEMY